MQIYKTGCNQITLMGATYAADERGIIDVPDDKINSSVWSQGFVSARGRIAQLDKESEAAIAPIITAPVASSTEVKPNPVDKIDAKSTIKE